MTVECAIFFYFIYFYFILFYFIDFTGLPKVGSNRKVKRTERNSPDGMARTSQDTQKKR